MTEGAINLNALFNVNGRVVVVTGGATGIGLGMAKALESSGASTVYIVSRRLDILQNAAKRSDSGVIVPLQGDITLKSDLLRVSSHIEAETGYVDLVIANAGIGGPDLCGLPESPTVLQLRDKLWEPSIESFSQTFTVNTAGTFFTAVAFLALLDAGNRRRHVAEPKSQFIAVSSISGFNRNVPGGFAYGASKAATIQMGKQFATLLAPYGIRSNVIAPGIFHSEMTSANMIKSGQDPERSLPASVVPEERMGDNQDIAGAVLFLASRAGAYCNGMVLVTDGGRLSVTPASY